MRKKFLGIAMGLSIIAASRARADVIPIGDLKDNTMFQSSGTASLGGGQSMFAGTNGALSPRRGLIAFDIADNVPAGSIITNVSLTLYLSQVAGSGMGGGGGSPTIGLFKTSADWGEGTSGGSINGAGGTGQGFPAGDGDATWIDSHYSATSPTLWTNQGGDFSSTESGLLTIVGTTVNVAYTWPSTSNMVADVQSWLDHPATNFGWTLKNDDETDATTFRAFWTKEAARTNQGTLSPQLSITYSAAPEPSSAALAIGYCLFTSRRYSRRR